MRKIYDAFFLSCYHNTGGPDGLVAMGPFRLIFIPCFLLLVFSVDCASQDASRLKETVLKIRKHEFRVEIVDTPEARIRGFMEREYIEADRGMLFVFPRDHKLSFWMKNTRTPLSIAYIDSCGEIREIYHMEPCSEKPVSSRVPVRYALEVNKGRFSELGIGAGDRIMIAGGLPSTRE